MATSPTEPKRCWICLESDHAEPGFAWRKVCKCNLDAHEICLIRWVATEDSSGKRHCPQCETPIRIRQGSSMFFSLRQLIDHLISGVSSGVFTGVVLSGLGTAIGASAYALLYGLGSSYIRLMCSPSQTDQILGPLMEAAQLPGGMLPAGLSTAGLLRRLLLIPQIPLALIASRSRMFFTGPYLTLLPMLAAGSFGVKTRWHRSLMYMVALRYFHRQIYDFFVEDTIQAATLELFGPEPPQDEEAAMAEAEFEQNMRQFEMVIEAAMQEPGPARAPDVNNMDDEFLTRFENLRVAMPAIPAEPRTLEELRDIVRLLGEDAHQKRLAARNPDGVLRPGKSDWVLGNANFIKSIAYPLILPYAGVAVAKLLRFLPLFKSAPILELNLVGGAIVVVLRDIVNLITVKQRVDKVGCFHVLDYDEEDPGEANWADRLSEKIMPLLQLQFIIG